MNKCITSKRLRELLHYDPNTGIFTWRESRSNKCRAGDVAGGRHSKGYISITVDGHKGAKAHRLAWLYMTGEWPTEQVDHRDTVRHNNSWENLRQATQAQNAQNQQRPSRNNKSGYLGVTWDRKQCKWAATIYINGRNKRLGRHKTAEEAYAAYMASKVIYHPFVGVSG